MNFETILFEVIGGVGKIILNRPDKLNSFNAQMHEEIRSCMKNIAEDTSIRCLLLTGSGRGFCAGQDLSDRDITPDDEAPDLGGSIERNYNPLLRSIKSLEKPVICAVNGVAAGAGANIALACDIVFAARSASFIQSFSKIGLVPDSGGTWTLPRVVGHARAMALAMLAERVSAQQAEDWGMIWKCVDDEELMSVAENQAAFLATRPTRGLAYIKHAINVSSTSTFDQQLDIERDLQRLAGGTQDYREGVDAFINKREPHFTGQ
ncbi:MAG: 2-(1,2-epoxy-1,2-dihydrophenyl)acetyl-CoA isomerase PaaG [Gammaproteobacteria bacterium]|nr:2-(1,2-epoxy-1,2-dihydrophenyl)acetyl-CoA isomerase PaaG [Gammaproteobacteria bacterium]